MVSFVIKAMLIALICANPISCAKETASATTSNSPTSTSTTAVPTPTDSAKEVTDQVEASAQVDTRQLDPNESRQRSKAQGYSDQGRSYPRHRGPSGSQKNRYEDHAVEYARDPPDEDFYKNSEEAPYRHQRPRPRPRHHAEYIDSFEGADEPPRQEHRGHDHSYEEQHPPDKGRIQYSGRDPGHYGYQDYSKEESYESREVRDKGYPQDGGKQYFQRGHEGSRKKQQATYDPLDVPDGDVDSRYGPGETKVHPPRAYYPRPRPKPKRYQTENHKEAAYNPGRPREGSYFQPIPREAGYSPEGQREPDYLQTPPKKALPYHHQAGYSPAHHHHHPGPQGPNPDYMGPKQHKQGPAYPPRPNEPRHGDSPETGYLIKQHEDILQILQKKSERSPDGGKVSIHIKHLGYSALPGGNTKGRQGFLLLPIVSDNMEQVKGYLGGNNKLQYDDERERGHRQRVQQEKQTYFERDVQHPKHLIESPLTIPQDYPQDYDSPRPPTKGFPHPQFGNFRPILKQPFYDSAEYEPPRLHHVQEYSEEVSQEGHPHSVPKDLPSPYGDRHELKPLRRPHLAYDGPHGVIPSFIGAVKYEPPSLYENKPPRYDSPYDVTRAFRSLPSKVRGFHPSFYSSLHRFADFQKPGDYASLSLSRPRKKNSETSLLYSTQYRNVANRLAAEYGRPKLESEAKRQSFVQQNGPERELEDYRSAYPSEARPYRKTLTELGLPHYESVLSQPKNGRTAVGALYYDLAPHPANQDVAQVAVDRPDSKGDSPNIEIFV